MQLHGSPERLYDRSIVRQSCTSLNHRGYKYETGQKRHTYQIWGPSAQNACRFIIVIRHSPRHAKLDSNWIAKDLDAVYKLKTVHGATIDHDSAVFVPGSSIQSRNAPNAGNNHLQNPAVIDRIEFGISCPCAECGFSTRLVPDNSPGNIIARLQNVIKRHLCQEHGYIDIKCHSFIKWADKYKFRVSLTLFRNDENINQSDLLLESSHALFRQVEELMDNTLPCDEIPRPQVEFTAAVSTLIVPDQSTRQSIILFGADAMGCNQWDLAEVFMDTNVDIFVVFTKPRHVIKGLDISLY